MQLLIIPIGDEVLPGDEAALGHAERRRAAVQHRAWGAQGEPLV